MSRHNSHSCLRQSRPALCSSQSLWRCWGTEKTTGLKKGAVRTAMKRRMRVYVCWPVGLTKNIRLSRVQLVFSLLIAAGLLGAGPPTLPKLRSELANSIDG